MTSTYTTRGRANLQGTGDNTDAWGPELNNGALQRLDDMWGGATITVNGNVTLTVENALTDQSRGFVIRMTGAGGFTVTHPDVEKPYLLANDCAAAVTFQPNGGTGVSVPAGWRGLYYTNAAGDAGYLVNLRLDQIAAPTSSVSLNSQKITNLATPTASADAATKGYIDTLASSGNLATVAGIAPQIVTVAGVASDIPTVAAVASDIPLLAAIDGDIAQLADMFVGASASNPTTRLDGSPLQAGDYYLNTSGTPAVRVFDGTNWIPIAAVTLASQVEAEAGVNNTNVMTPLRTAQAIAALAGNVTTETFTASGTFTKDADDIAYFVELIGGGGGGTNNTASSTTEAGGGGGQYTSGFFASSEVGASVSVTIGAGGAGRATGTGGSGTDGGTSTFGSLLSAAGGRGASQNGFVFDTSSISTIAATNATEIRGISLQTGGFGGGAVINVGGGNTVRGGGGGGGSNSGVASNGGISQFHGDGGAGNNTAATPGGDGTAPGGGGGGSGNNGGGGNGARGECKVYRFKRTV